MRREIWETAVRSPQVIYVNQCKQYIPEINTVAFPISQEILQPCDKIVTPPVDSDRTCLRIYEYSRPHLKNLSSVCYKSKKVVEEYEESCLESLYLNLFISIDNYDDLGQPDLGGLSPTRTITINSADDTLFLISESDPADFSLVALAVTIRGGAQRIRNLALSHGWFESLEFNKFLDFSEGVASPLGS
jgi:hypothetical protein